MKNRIVAAALAAFLLLPVFGLAAYAAEPQGEEYEYNAGYDPDPEQPDQNEGEYAEYSDMVIGISADMGADFGTDFSMDDIGAEEMAALLSLFMLPFLGMMNDTPFMAEPDPDMVTLPTAPPGTATVIEFNTDPLGRLFFTIMTPDEHVFYLVVDTTSNLNNVYFLNAVTVADLLPLAQFPEQPQGGIIGGGNIGGIGTGTPNNGAAGTEQENGTSPDTPENEQQGGGNMGMILFVLVIAVIGGGAGWYFKIYRPKQQRAASGEEYDPSLNDMDNDYSEDWGADPDEDDMDEADDYDYSDDVDDTDEAHFINGADGDYDETDYSDNADDYDNSADDDYADTHDNGDTPPRDDEALEEGAGDGENESGDEK